MKNASGTRTHPHSHWWHARADNGHSRALEASGGTTRTREASNARFNRSWQDWITGRRHTHRLWSRVAFGLRIRKFRNWLRASVLSAGHYTRRVYVYMMSKHVQATLRYWTVPFLLTSLPIALRIALCSCVALHCKWVPLIGNNKAYIQGVTGHTQSWIVSVYMRRFGGTAREEKPTYMRPRCCPIAAWCCCRTTTRAVAKDTFVRWKIGQMVRSAEYSMLARQHRPRPFAETKQCASRFILLDDGISCVSIRLWYEKYWFIIYLIYDASLWRKILGLSLLMIDA